MKRRWRVCISFSGYLVFWNKFLKCSSRYYKKSRQELNPRKRTSHGDGTDLQNLDLGPLSKQGSISCTYTCHIDLLWQGILLLRSFRRIIVRSRLLRQARDMGSPCDVLIHCRYKDIFIECILGQNALFQTQ